MEVCWRYVSWYVSVKVEGMLEVCWRYVREHVVGYFGGMLKVCSSYVGTGPEVSWKVC